MQYIQLVEFNTNHPVDEVKQALDAWLVASRGKRTPHMAVVAVDHDRPNHYWELLEYVSEQEAVKTAELPETKAAFERWSRLLEGEPVFHNLDVIEQVGAPEEGPLKAPRRGGPRTLANRAGARCVASGWRTCTSTRPVSWPRSTASLPNTASTSKDSCSGPAERSAWPSPTSGCLSRRRRHPPA